MNLKTVCTDLSSSKFQSDEQAAIQALKVIKFIAQKSYTTSQRQCEKELMDTKEQLIQATPNNPCLQNSLKFVFYDTHSLNVRSYQDKIIAHVQLALAYFTSSHKVIAKLGERKIKSGMVVYTHAYSISVIQSLKEAKSAGKNFLVYCTETRPLFSGRVTAKALAQAGIPVTLVVDTAMSYAISKADIILLGADMILPDGKVLGALGYDIIATLGKQQVVPFYICSQAWKYNHKGIEKMEVSLKTTSEKIIWDAVPKRVKIENPPYAIIPSDAVSGIISELGIYQPESCIAEIKARYPSIL